MVQLGWQSSKVDREGQRSGSSRLQLDMSFRVEQS